MVWQHQEADQEKESLLQQPQQALVEKVCEMYEKISALETLKPCKDVDMLFTQLVLMCIPPNPIDVTKLSKRVQEIRSKLIGLCGEAEGYLESHYSTILGSFENPLENINIFPYYSNYAKLSQLEFNLLSQYYCSSMSPSKIAFVGSGPLPLTSIVLATFHMKNTIFHNYDIDPLANSMASRLVQSHPDLSKRMFFHTTDVMDVVGDDFKVFDVVFLAALVGMNKEEKCLVIDHLAKHMAPGAILMLRSAHGARAFLYPVVEPCDLCGFEVLTVFHPTDEVINSVVVARKKLINESTTDDHHQLGTLGSLMQQNNIPVKCSEIQANFNLLNLQPNNMIEELTIEEHLF